MLWSWFWPGTNTSRRLASSSSDQSDRGVHCKDAGCGRKNSFGSRNTTCAKFLWQKHVSNAFRRVLHHQTPPISTDLEAEVQRLRTLLAQMEASQSNLCRHPPQSSSQAADMLKERAAKRCVGVADTSQPTGKTSNVGCQRSIQS